MRLCRRHLVHQVVWIDGLVLLLLRLQQLRVEGAAEVCGVERVGLGEVAARKKAVEVGTGRVCDVEVVGLEVVALGPELRRVVLRQVGVGL